jgi:hypothetical protein
LQKRLAYDLQALGKRVDVIFSTIPMPFIWWGVEILIAISFFTNILESTYN